jgi:hypothetical protein
MLIIGIVLSFVVLAYLCWLLFTLAVNALPFFAGVTAGFATYHSGSGPIGAIIVGLIASSITFPAGQIAFTMIRSPLIRAAIALLFALPAAVAAYHAALGLAQIGVPTEGWRQAIAVIGSIAVAATACSNRVMGAHSAHCPARYWRGIAAGFPCSAIVRSTRRLNPPSVV